MGIAMINFLRCFLLFVSLCGLGVVWVRGAHPEWVIALDQWVCDRHVEESRELWEKVSSNDDAGKTAELQIEVAEHLQNLGAVWSVERRFPMWNNLVLWLIGRLRETEELDGAQYWLQRLLEVTPHNMPQTLALAEVCIAKGKPSDLQQADELLQSLHTLMPTWGAVPEARLRLAVRSRNWQEAMERLGAYQKMESAGLANKWQWFIALKGQEKTRRINEIDAHVVDGDYTLSCSSLKGIPLKSVRVDPKPGARGELVQVRYVGILKGGGTIDIKVKSARDCEWDGTKRSLRLTGTRDPRVTLLMPQAAIQGLQVHFRARGPIPAWVWHAAEENSEFARLLIAGGHTPPPKGGQN